jgi:hypothetical protein
VERGSSVFNLKTIGGVRLLNSNALCFGYAYTLAGRGRGEENYSKLNGV